MATAMLEKWKGALVRVLAGTTAGGWLVGASSSEVKDKDHKTPDEKRALRAGYKSVGQYEKAMAAKSRARRIHATTSYSRS